MGCNHVARRYPDKWRRYPDGVRRYPVECATLSRCAHAVGEGFAHLLPEPNCKLFFVFGAALNAS